MGVDEILVHLSGPSSRKDDQRFRTMALAYGAFEPLNRIAVYNGAAEDLPRTADHPDASSANAPATSSTLCEEESAQVPRTAPRRHVEVEDAEQEEQSEVRRDVCSYVEDTPLAAALIESQLWPNSPTATAVTHSSPLAKRRRLSPEHERSDDTFVSAAPELAPILPNQDEEVHPVIVEEPRAATPASSSSPIYYVSSTENQEVVAAPNIPPQGEIPSEAIPEHSTLARHPKAGPRLITPTTTVPGAASTAPHTLKPSPQISEPAAPEQLKALSFQIHAPPPPVALFAHPTDTPTLIPPSLQQFLTISHLKGRYKPSTQTRQVRPMERGHWRVDTSSWTADTMLQREFWESLEGFVGSGRAGWGVWAVREGEDADGGGDGECVEAGAEAPRGQGYGVQGAASSRGTSSLGTIRVYHFGQMAQHIYLLLFVLSKSRIRKCAVQWIDAAGEVVVRM